MLLISRRFCLTAVSEQTREAGADGEYFPGLERYAGHGGASVEILFGERVDGRGRPRKEGSSMAKILEWYSYLNPREVKALSDNNLF